MRRLKRTFGKGGAAHQAPRDTLSQKKPALRPVDSSLGGDISAVLLVLVDPVRGCLSLRPNPQRGQRPSQLLRGAPERERRAASQGDQQVTKRTAAKYKIDRRMGENIWGRPKSPVNRREFGPGQHGQRRKGKMSDFGLQLRAKQKLKGYYGDLTEKQFKRIYAEAARVKGDTGENLIGLLERRLDAVVYRAKFVPTMFAARQFVNHGHVKVNGRRVNIPSYRVKEGDLIEVRDRSKQLAVLLEAVQLAERDVPDYIDADHSKMIATFVRTPGLGDVPYPVMMEPNLVIEFYAQN